MRRIYFFIISTTIELTVRGKVLFVSKEPSRKGFH